MSQPNPIAALFHSRKFLVLLLDTFTSIVLYFGSKYLGDSYFADIKFLILALQAPALMLINAIATEDAAQIRAAALRCNYAQATKE